MFEKQNPYMLLQTDKESPLPSKDASHDQINKKERDTEEEKLCLGFDTILEKLKEDPQVLSKRIEKLKTLPDCDGILGKLAPFFSETHWEILAVLKEYDQATFDHSLRVTAFVYNMANNEGETKHYLKERIQMETSSFEELYTASLFHDIGKTAIPKAILHDNHSRREWGKRANAWAKRNGSAEHFNQEKLEMLDEIALDRYFMQVHMINKSDPLNIVPIETFFNKQDLEALQKNGISPHDTFRKVLECHEKATKAILRRQKMYIASDIASHHHDYERRPIRTERYQTEISAVRLGFELSLLRSLDVFDALTSSDRPYKQPYPPLLALDILIKEAETGFTEAVLTKYVVNDLYKALKSTAEVIPTNESEKQALQKIQSFIAS